MENETQTGKKKNEALHVFLRHFGLLLLFCVPVIGWFFAIAFALGVKKKDTHLTALARGWLAAAVVLIVIGALIFPVLVSMARYTFSLTMEYVDDWTDGGVYEIGGEGNVGDALLKGDFKKLYGYYKSGDFNIPWNFLMAITFASDMSDEDRYAIPGEHIIDAAEMQQKIDDALGKNDGTQTPGEETPNGENEGGSQGGGNSGTSGTPGKTDGNGQIYVPSEFVFGAGTGTAFSLEDLAAYTGLDTEKYHDIILQLVEIDDLDALTPQVVKAIDKDQLSSLIDDIVSLCSSRPELFKYFDLDSLRRLERIAARY